MNHQAMTARPRRRRGNAVVEFAVCLPVLVLFVMGAIEITNMVFVKQALTAAAYEAAREAVASGKGASEARLRAQQVLAPRNIQNAVVAFQPAEPLTAPRGTPIQVTIRASAASNTIAPQRFVQGINLEANINMVKE